MSCDRNGEGRDGCGRATCEKCYPLGFSPHGASCGKRFGQACVCVQAVPMPLERKSLASLTVYNGPDGTPWETKIDDNGCVVYNAPVPICDAFRHMEMRGDMAPSTGTLRIERRDTAGGMGGVAKAFAEALDPALPVPITQSNAATDSLLCPHCRRSLRAIFSLHSSG